MQHSDEKLFQSVSLSNALSRVSSDIALGKTDINPLLGELCARLEEFPGCDAEAERGRQFATGLRSVIGAEGLAGCVHYWEIRAQIHELQQQHQISGLVRGSVSIAGQSIDYLQHDDQLVLIPGDESVLLGYVPTVTSFFIYQVQRLSYRLFEELDDDLIEASSEQVLAASQRAFQSTISIESFDWRAVGDGRWQSCGHPRRYEPDKIRLWLDMEPVQADGELRVFVAKHHDASRFPWET